MLHVKLLCLASLFVASQMLNKATSFVVHLTVNTFQFLGDVIWLYKKLVLRTYFNRCIKYVYETGLIFLYNSKLFIAQFKEKEFL